MIWLWLAQAKELPIDVLFGGHIPEEIYKKHMQESKIVKENGDDDDDDDDDEGEEEEIQKKRGLEQA